MPKQTKVKNTKEESSPDNQNPASNPSSPKGYQKVNFDQLNMDTLAPKQDSDVGINALLDIQVELVVELGRIKKSIQEILEFGEGSIVSLDKFAGEALDIYVSHKLIAKGEAVVIGENFGIRITDIVLNRSS